MKYFVKGPEPLKIAGLEYAPGTVVELLGVELLEVFGDKVLPITDEKLLRTLEANAHPMVVVAPFRWGRVDYRVGDLYWLVWRSELKYMPAGALRPASGDEVLAWVRQREGCEEAPAEATAAPVEATSAPADVKKDRRKKVAA